MEQQQLIRSETCNTRVDADAGLSIGGANTAPITANLWISIRHYSKSLIRFRAIIALTCLLFILMAGAVSLLTKPVYRATSRVEVSGEVAQIEGLQDLYQNSPADEPFLETQVKILESDNLAQQTINQLNLRNNPEFVTTKNLPGIQKNQQNHQDHQDALLIEAIHDRVSVQLVPDTRMIEINVEDRNPELAAEIANALVSSYVNYSFQKRLDSTNQASSWMEGQIQDLKGKVERSQRALVDYRAQNSIVNLNDHENASEERLAELTKDLTDAQDDRMSKQAVAEQVKTEGVDSVAPTESMEHFQELYAQTNQDYIDALSHYGSEFPRVKRLKLQVDNYQEAIDAERNRLSHRIQGEFAAAQTKENKLLLAVNAQKQEVANINSRLVQENLLRHDFESNEQLYENLLQHQKDVTVSEGLRAANAHIVDRATIPLLPVRPRRFFNLVVGSASGLIVGVCLALLCGLLSNRIAEPEEVENLLMIPSLGIIPKDVKHFQPLKPKGTFLLSSSEDLVVLKRPASLQADSYRGLRTSVVRLRNISPANVLLITSPHRGEGKTRTALNLAISLAQRGHLVLLIDIDYRTQGLGPIVTTSLGVKQSQGGLIEVLNGTKTVEQTVRRAIAVNHLYLLASGAQTFDASDLLSSMVMTNLLSELRATFEYIVIDSAPILGVSDTSALAPIVDGVLLVLESDATSQDAAVQASKLIRNAGGHLLGTVLNKVPVRHSLYSRMQGLYRAS